MEGASELARGMRWRPQHRSFLLELPVGSNSIASKGPVDSLTLPTKPSWRKKNASDAGTSIAFAFS